MYKSFGEDALIKSLNKVFFGLFVPLMLFTSNGYAIVVPTATPCILLLEQLASGLSIGGNATINMAGNCLIHANSVGLASLSSVGGSLVTASVISTSGGVSGDGFTPIPQTFSPSIADPYATFVAPIPGPCLPKVKLANQTKTLLPGTYCGGVSISGDSNITLQSGGVYIFKGGDLRISGNSTLTGSCVLLYFTTDGKTYAGFDISGD